MEEEIKKCYKCGSVLKLGASGFSGSTIISLFCENCSKLSNDFEIFIECLFIGYKEFCLNQRMRKEIDSKIYETFRNQWDIILVSLEMNYKLWLAKILETRHECIKNYKFIDDYKKTEKSIEDWRNGFIAHFNSNNIKEYKKFVCENPLDDNSIKSLFYKVADIADQYNKNQIYSNKKVNETLKKIEEETSSDFNKWFEKFKKSPFWKRFFHR